MQRDGQIMFRGQRPIDPALDVAADGYLRDRRPGEHRRLDALSRLTLSSQPPLDQSDILSLIVFNQPANRLSQGQAADLGERAAQVAGGFVAAPLAEHAGAGTERRHLRIGPLRRHGQGPRSRSATGERASVHEVPAIFGAQDVSEFQFDYQLPIPAPAGIDRGWTDLGQSFADAARRARRYRSRRLLQLLGRWHGQAGRLSGRLAVEAGLQPA